LAHPVKDAARALSYLWNREAKLSIERLLDEMKPDVVHLHNIYHHLSTSILEPIRRRRLPCVQTLHDYKVAGCANYKMFTEGAPCERCKDGDYTQAIRHKCTSLGFLPNVLAALEMGIVKARQPYEKTVRMFLCPSRFMKEKMEDWGLPRTKLRLAVNPTDVSGELASGGGGYVLYVGRLSPEKGVKKFLEAAALVPELPIKIVGRGPEEAALRAFVKEKGMSQVEFLGFQPPVEVRKIRARAEALVLPTLMYENASGSVLEAMADGLPCLVSRIGGNPELVEDGVNGFMATPGDTEDWLRLLRRFLATPADVRQKMGLIGHDKIVETRTWETHLTTIFSAYREVGVVAK
jgi:glycosyltransferase involved in cell wall biosynthesis